MGLEVFNEDFVKITGGETLDIEQEEVKKHEINVTNIFITPIDPG